MSGSVSALPVAPDWATWAQGNYLPPAGGEQSLGPAAVNPNLPPESDLTGVGSNPAVGAGGILAAAKKKLAELMPVTSGAAPDASAPGGSVAPDGTMVPSQAVPTPAQAAAGGNQVQAIGHALLPAVVPPQAPAPTPAPQAPPGPPPAALQAALAAQQGSAPTPAAPPPAASPAPAPAAPPGPIAPPAVPPIAKAQALLNPQGAPQAPIVNNAEVPPQNVPARDNGSYWSTAQPPPPTVAPMVQAAAAKYGVPMNVATWVGSHENNWQPTGMNPQSGTIGMWQFKPATAKQYGIDPTDPAQATDGAMHYLSDLAKKNGGDWAAAVNQYGTTSTGLGPQFDQAAKTGLQAFLGGSAPGGPMIAGTSAQPGSAPGVPGAAPQADQNDPTKYMAMIKGMLPYNPASLGMNSGQKLLAMAGGLLSGRGSADAFGKGFSALANANEQDLQNKRAINAQTMQMAQLGMMTGYRVGNQAIQQQKANTLKPIGTPVMGPDGAMIQRMLNPQTNETTYQPVPGQTTQEQNVGLRGTQVAFNTSPDQQAAKAQDILAAKNAQADITQLQNSRVDDTQSMAENAQARQLIQQNPSMMGPTLQARATRSLAEMGIAGDPNTLQAIQKMTSEQRNDYLTQLTGGHVGALRSNAAIKNISQAVADVGTSPQAADYIMRAQQWDAQSRMDFRNQVQQLAQTDPAQLTGRNYGTMKDQFMQNWIKQNPVPLYQQGANVSAPAPSGASGGQASGPLSGSSNGVKWSFTPSS